MTARPAVPFSCVFLEDDDGTARCAECRRRLIDVEAHGCRARRNDAAVIAVTLIAGAVFVAASLASCIWP